MTLPELSYARTYPVAEASAPHPEPEERGRPATASEIPVGARRAMKAAEGLGWQVSPTYARGTTIDRHGRPGKVVHSLALRMRLPGTPYWAVAVWQAPVGTETTKWSSEFACVGLVGAGATSARQVPLTAGKKDPDALNLAAYLADPSRLTEPQTVGSVGE